jgi:hypothetical protein
MKVRYHRIAGRVRIWLWILIIVSTLLEELKADGAQLGRLNKLHKVARDRLGGLALAVHLDTLGLGLLLGGAVGLDTAFREIVSKHIYTSRSPDGTWSAGHAQFGHWCASWW